MKFVHIQHNGSVSCGIVGERGVLPLEASLEDVISGAYAVSEEQLATEQGWIAEEQVVFEPCVPRGSKIVCVGLNYRNHAKEAGLPVPEYPILFNKFSNGLVGHQGSVTLPAEAQNCDYEAELGVVIGKKAKNVGKEEALEYVFGYCNVNDLSARDLQNRTSQWMLGKVLDGFCPVGPYLVTADEVGDPNELDIKLFLNGEQRQSSNTRDMIFTVPEVISYISTFMTLEPGDIILTGTPEGVIAGYPQDQRTWLKPGDVMTVEIEKLGSLTNVLKG
ncbi:fumarylacetoacetate hydrolase family protein [Paenibacillus sp. YYML68]|uniref:fumarylacetoacetate hydrolase family protein n=1 Tax=Paenibacillus sp. YYML68 TaxID=2909250 RepID=UPI0024905DD1|nr:fumarylacetoacetate hydrolase family protein [Paenibacillus sp. YYML68]